MTSKGVNVPALIVVIIFYLLIVAVGVGAAWYKRKQKGNRSELIMVAGRDIGLAIGSFTMTATWVGGGYINGTAEYIYTPGYGLVWTNAPWGYAMGLVLGGLFFAKQMRREGYVTMIDPLQRKFGKRMGGILFLPALVGELFWSAAILAALGGTLSVIINLNFAVSTIISAAIAVLYTMIGGMYSVAFTDVVQLACIFVGLWICIPFAFLSEYVIDITETKHVAFEADPEVNNATTLGWLGEWDPSYAGMWFDSTFLLFFGGIPWQVYFQRVLSAKTASSAQLLSFIAAGGCIVMAIPPVLIGAIAASTNWTAAGYSTAENNFSTPYENNDAQIILPLVLSYLTPTAVSVVGLGAVSAAVMSSADSSILSVSSMFTHNIYKNTFRQGASQTELVWVMRASILIVAVAATALGIKVRSVYLLWFLCSDFLYVLLFPHLLSVIYFDPNTYGAIPAFIIGLILRIGGGEASFKFTGFIPYGQNTNVPHKTIAMVVTLVTLLVVSYTAKFLFEHGIIPPEWDVLKCKLAEGGKNIKLKQRTEDTPSEETPTNAGIDGNTNPSSEHDQEEMKKVDGNGEPAPSYDDVVAADKNGQTNPAFVTSTT